MQEIVFSYFTSYFPPSSLSLSLSLSLSVSLLFYACPACWCVDEPSDHLNDGNCLIALLQVVSHHSETIQSQVSLDLLPLSEQYFEKSCPQHTVLPYSQQTIGKKPQKAQFMKAQCNHCCTRSQSQAHVSVRAQVLHKLGTLNKPVSREQEERVCQRLPQKKNKLLEEKMVCFP